MLTLLQYGGERRVGRAQYFEILIRIVLATAFGWIQRMISERLNFKSITRLSFFGHSARDTLSYLLLPTIERVHCVRDILAEPLHCAILGRHQHGIVFSRRRLAHRRAAGLGRAIFDAPYQPNGIERRRIA